MSEPADTSDNLSRSGAAALAARLDAYWHAKGAVSVRHWVEPAALAKATRAAVWVVRSNLVRGQPPRRRASSPLQAQP